jgi:hypothetical protein
MQAHKRNSMYLIDLTLERIEMSSAANQAIIGDETPWKFDSWLYQQHHVTLTSMGSPAALAAMNEFFNGSWLQSEDHPAFLESMLTEGGVNLREEGLATRHGDIWRFWPGMTYFDEDHSAEVPHACIALIVAENLKFLHRKAAFLAALRRRDIRTKHDLPPESERPRFP